MEIRYLPRMLGDREVKIIFLDMDGVLCTSRAHIAYGGEGLMSHLDPVAVKLIERLTVDCHAKIVLSSTWREFHDQLEMTRFLQMSGMSKVRWHQAWKTPVRFSGTRADEIKDWLNGHGGQDCNFVIFDDDDDMLHQFGKRFIRTREDDGLSFADFTIARNLLGTQK